MIFRMELNNYIKGTVIAAIVLGFFLIMVISMYPMMQDQMAGMMRMIENLGMFKQALKIDGLIMSELLGFYGMEMENMLGVGGAFFAGYLGIKLIAKEESYHTAEFMLSHPMSRVNFYLQKSLAAMILILLFNGISATIAYLGIVFSNQNIVMNDFIQLHYATFLVHLFILWFCLGASAFMRQDLVGVGLGYVFILYVLNIFINLFKELEYLKWITPFQFAYTADILGQGLNYQLVMTTGTLAIVVWLLGAIYYNQKDIYG